MNHPELIACVAVYSVAVLVAIGLLLWACKTDFLSMTIPNEVSLGLIGSFCVAFVAAGLIHLPAFSNWKVHGAALGVMFVLTFIMFMAKVWGAGDSKLATGVAFWIGLKGMATFLLVTSIAGLVLVALTYVFQKTKWNYARLGHQSWPARVQAGERNVPYGIAIVFGALAAFCELGYFNLSHLLQGLQ